MENKETVSAVMSDKESLTLFLHFLICKDANSSGVEKADKDVTPPKGIQGHAPQDLFFSKYQR